MRLFLAACMIINCLGIGAMLILVTSINDNLAFLNDHLIEACLIEQG